MTSDRPIDCLMIDSKDTTLDPRLQKEARHLAASGYRVRVLAWDRAAAGPASQWVDGYEIVRFHRRSRTGSGLRQALGFARFWWWTVRQAMALRPAPRVVHCHDLDTFLPAYRIARRLRVPLVFDAHELYGEMQVGRMPSPIISMLRSFERLAIRRSDATLVVGDACRAYFESYAREVWMVGNGFETVQIDAATRMATREELGVPPDGFLISFIGWLTEAKNLDPLVEAVEKDPSLYAVIGGTGEQEPRLREIAARQPRLRMIGFATEPHRINAAADALYYLFRREYAYADYLTGNTIGMSIAHGKPLICDARGDAGRLAARLGPDLVMREPTGAEVLRVVGALRQPGRREEIARMLRAEADGPWSWGASARTLSELYGRLLAAEAVKR